nr:MetaGeneMark_Unknown Function [uncultured bacterium]
MCFEGTPPPADQAAAAPQGIAQIAAGIYPVLTVAAAPDPATKPQPTNREDKFALPFVIFVSTAYRWIA